MEKYVIRDAEHWVISHRKDSRYPGYLMVSSREQKSDLHELSFESLQELGVVLRDAEKLLRSVYSPFKVLFAKLGFSSGFACHFHAIPVTHELLAEVAVHPQYVNEPDGNDVMLFVSRIYCERELSTREQAEMMGTIATLRKAASIQL